MKLIRFMTNVRSGLWILTGFGLITLILSLSVAQESAGVDKKEVMGSVWLKNLDPVEAIFTPVAPVGRFHQKGGFYQKRIVLDNSKWKSGNLQYSHVIEHVAPSRFVVQLPEGKVHFSTGLIIKDTHRTPGRYEIRIYGDGKLLWSSGEMTPKSEKKICDLELNSIRYFVMCIDPIGNFVQEDSILWLDPKFECSASQVGKIRFVNLPVDDCGNIIELTDEKSKEYLSLSWQIKAGMSDRVKSQAYHPESTLMKSDRDPLDIILRRTKALCAHLQKMDAAPELTKESQQLAHLQKQCDVTDPSALNERRRLFDQVFDLRREIALSNPLLDFNDIVFIKRHYLPESERHGNHMCDEFFGFHGIEGGGLFLLKNAFAKDPKDQKIVDLLKNATISNGRLQGQKIDSRWACLAPTLSYDAQEIIFAATDTKTKRHSYEWNNDSCYHLFKIGIDGKGLTQLTDGPYNDIDPWIMPNGRVVFISERRGGYGRCHARPCPNYTLHSMEQDGSDIICLSPHETNEWSPMVDKNGMVVYTRWDYVDRGYNQAHHPWITFPDGRDPRAIQGQYSESEFCRPHFETSLKPVPDSHKIAGTAKGHHTQYFGSVILLDPNVEDDDTGGDPMAPIRRITPDQLFPESEAGTHGYPTNYGQPFPLSEEFYLVVYDPFSGSGRGLFNNFGLYLLDMFGNKIFLYRDPSISIQCPWPVAERDVPPIIPHQTLVGIPKSQRSDGGVKPVEASALPKTATVGVINVYNTNRPFPKGATAKELRIVQILPKTTWNCNDPWIGYGAEKSARKILGTVPIESDGSARFELPVDVPVYFQALDENGVAIQSMRSVTYVKPGETLTCHGCHEGRYNTASNRPSGFPTAFQRPSSMIKPEMPGSNPFNYPTLVQPILDKHCVDCHEKELFAGRTFTLGRGQKKNHFFDSYLRLRPYVFVYSSNHNKRMDPPISSQPNRGGAYDRFLDARTFPGKFGANASPLWTLLKENHYGVHLSDSELRAIALWLDNNADFYGEYSYDSLEAQREGKIVKPSLE